MNKGFDRGEIESLTQYRLSSIYIYMRSFDLAFLKLSTKKNINKCSHEIGKGKFCLLAISKTPMPLKNLLCIVRVER